MPTAELCVSVCASDAMQLTLREIQSAPSPSVTAANWDAMTLTMDYSSDSSNPQSPRLRLPLVKGSPYITAQVRAAQLVCVFQQ